MFEESARSVDLRCGNAAEADLAPESLDAVLTDPPYFGKVQYAELMDFCYVWLKRFAPDSDLHFREDMKKLLLATRGKVFTLKTLDMLVDYSDLKNYRTK